MSQVFSVGLAELEAFLTVAEEHHFGRASQRLGLGPPTLSKRVAQLEHDLGVMLFDRTSRRVRLTPAGDALVEPARRALGEYSAFLAAAEQTRAGATGTLRLAYSSGMGEPMALLVRRLREHTPLVTIELEQKTSVQIIEAVRDGDVMLGLSHFWPGNGLSGLQLSEASELHVAMPAEHALAASCVIEIDQLAGITLLVALPSQAPELPDHGPAAIRYVDVPTEVQYLDLVASGLGLALIPPAMLRRNPRSDLISRRLAGSSHPGGEFLIWRTDHGSPLVARVVAIAQELLDEFAALASGGRPE